MPESVQSCFELSIHLSVWRTSHELLLKIVRGRNIQGNGWKVQNSTGRFLAQLITFVYFWVSRCRLTNYVLDRCASIK